MGNTYTNLSYSDPHSFLAGPMMELCLPKEWSIEVNALRRPLRYTAVTDFPGAPGIAVSPPFHASVSSWQFPLLLKYRLPVSKIQPFVAAGPSFRTVAVLGSRPSAYGMTGGAGVEMRAGKFHFAPSVRYTRWGSDALPFRPTIRNQVELVAGVRYATDASKLRVFNEKLWFGIIAGIPLTNDLHPAAPADLAYMGAIKRVANFRSAAGLMAEVDISKNLSVEVNGLYRRLHFRDGPEIVVTWEIPVLAKYKFSGPAVQPFVELGPSFRPTGNLNNTDPSHYGMTGGAGVEGHVRRMRFTPTLRYTRWATDNHVPVSQQPFTKLDQVELLVGVSF